MGEEGGAPSRRAEGRDDRHLGEQRVGERCHECDIDAQEKGGNNSVEYRAEELKISRGRGGVPNTVRYWSSFPMSA
jgi:hypothetical protein